MLSRSIAAFGLILLASVAHAAGNGDRMIERLKQADANGDGNITRDELSAYRRTQFARLDRDADGYVTQAEIARLKRFLPDGLDGDQIIKQFDKNGDGKVSADEFANGPAPLFARLDTNHDSVVSADELKAGEAELASLQRR